MAHLDATALKWVHIPVSNVFLPSFMQVPHLLCQQRACKKYLKAAHWCDALGVPQAAIKGVPDRQCTGAGCAGGASLQLEVA